MLSTSYEAFYTMDNLRHRANITVAQMAEIIDWNDVQYRAVKRKVENGVLGGLNGKVDIKVRKGIMFLSKYFKSGKLPVDPSKATVTKQATKNILAKLYVEFYAIEEGRTYPTDVIGYIAAKRFGKDQFIETHNLIGHASNFIPKVS